MFLLLPYSFTAYFRWAIEGPRAGGEAKFLSRSIASSESSSSSSSSSSVWFLHGIPGAVIFPHTSTYAVTAVMEWWTTAASDLPIAGRSRRVADASFVVPASRSSSKVGCSPIIFPPFNSSTYKTKTHFVQFLELQNAGFPCFDPLVVCPPNQMVLHRTLELSIISVLKLTHRETRGSKFSGQFTWT